MRHRASRNFWKCYEVLPSDVRNTADRCHRLLEENPRHPSLHFKLLFDDIWSARAGLNHRPLATKVDDDFVWFWIGTHAEYDRLIGR